MELSRKAEILLVEDNEADIRLTKEALEETEVLSNLSVVKDGEKALDFVFKRKGFEEAPSPDLILLDLNLPYKSGKEVLAEIKSHPELKSIPVVMLSTSQAREDINGAYQLHANCFLSKPVDFEEFVSLTQKTTSYWLETAKLPEI